MLLRSELLGCPAAPISPEKGGPGGIGGAGGSSSMGGMGGGGASTSGAGMHIASPSKRWVRGGGRRRGSERAECCL